MTGYCVDTSAWLDGWQRHYTPDVFPSLWREIEARIEAGEIFSSDEVYVELEKKSDELHQWIMKRKSMLVPLSVEVQQLASELLVKFPRLTDTLRGRSNADPFVIATAKHLNLTVVTGEHASGNLNKPRIPDACAEEGIRCLTFLEMIRELKFSF